MIDDVQQDAERRMAKSVAALQDGLKKIRAGRAHPGLLDHLMVEYYGNPTPLKQVANVGAEDARTLTVSPWEKQMVAVVEKAIRESDLGLNPATSGQVIRVPLPPLTEERRRELTKVVRNEGEQCRVALRNIRRDALSMLKELVKEKEISQDDETRAAARVQTLTDQHVAEVEKLVEAKETDLLDV
ncbi:MAG: ribosome recycling factor [Pseudomonadota bacterium]|nr:ribosome recycling factor [Pseudomonadota bacterium]